MAPNDDTDIGNAARLVRAGLEQTRHEYDANGWYTWDGRAWREGAGPVMELAKRAALDHLGQVLSDPERRGMRSDEWARRSLSAPRLKAAIELARSDPRIAIAGADFDTDPDLLNTPSGVVDLRSGALLDHAPGRFMRSMTGAAYDPAAPCSAWEASLLRAMGGDAELVGYLQRVFGYASTGRTDEQVFWLYVGLGASGKSTTLATLARVLGSYAKVASAGVFLHAGGAHSGPDPELHRLVTARFVYTSEVDAAGRLNETRLRMLTRSESVASRTLYSEVVERRPKMKLVFASNTEPRVSEHHDGTWRRIHLVRWDHQVEAEARDRRFEERLWAEADGILAWVVRGAMEWYRSGLRPPPRVADWVGEYRRSEDHLGRFLAERAVLDSSASVGATEVWGAYSAWRARQGLPSVAQREFGTSMGARFARDRDGSTGRITYVGLSLDGARERSGTKA